MTTATVTKQLQRTLIFSKGGVEKRYVLSNVDYLDLLRAVEFEGKPKIAVAWTLLQRFALLYPQYSSLSSFIKAYAQPINPRWFPKGDLHQGYLALLRSRGDAKGADFENQRAEKRESKASTTMAKIGQDTKLVVDGVFLNHLSPVPGSIHYHAPLVTTNIAEAVAARTKFAADKKYDVVDYGPVLSGNWFYGNSQSKNFSVFAVFEDLTSIGSALLALGYTSSVLYMAYALAKRFFA